MFLFNFLINIGFLYKINLENLSYEDTINALNEFSIEI